MNSLHMVITPPLKRQRSIVMGSVSSHLSVCPHVVSKFHQIFHACYLWPWPGPPPAALRHVVGTSGSVDDVSFARNGKGDTKMANTQTDSPRATLDRWQSLISTIPYRYKEYLDINGSIFANRRSVTLHFMQFILQFKLYLDRINRI